MWLGYNRAVCRERVLPQALAKNVLKWSKQQLPKTNWFKCHYPFMRFHHRHHNWHQTFASWGNSEVFNGTYIIWATPKKAKPRPKGFEFRSLHDSMPFRHVLIKSIMAAIPLRDSGVNELPVKVTAATYRLGRIELTKPSKTINISLCHMATNTWMINSSLHHATFTTWSNK